MSKPVFNGVAPHEDMFPFPKAEDLEASGGLWKWTDPTVISMTDYTLAASNAISKVWEEANYTEGMCNIHVFLRWIPKGEVKDREVRTKMNVDFEKYKRCPFVLLVPVLRAAMVIKWKKVYDVPGVADKWMKQWAPTKHTMVELNDQSFLEGGIPAHNNGCEGLNNGDKEYLDRRKPSAVSFVQDLANLLSDRSKGDLSFNGTLHRDVHNAKFYKHCHEILEQSRAGEPTFLDVTFPFSSSPLSIPSDSMLVASTRFLDGALQAYPIPKKKGKRSRVAIAINTIKANNLLSDFKDLMICPESFATRLKFDQIVDWMWSFHLIKPIVFNDEEDWNCIVQYLQMLQESGLQTITPEELHDLGPKGLVSCSCSNYLHCAWCKHSFCYAWKHGVVKGFPSRMDPTSTMKNIAKPLAGAPRKSKGGDSLNRNG
jgi:hypothetical protein